MVISSSGGCTQYSWTRKILVILCWSWVAILWYFIMSFSPFLDMWRNWEVFQRLASIPLLENWLLKFNCTSMISLNCLFSSIYTMWIENSLLCAFLSWKITVTPVVHWFDICRYSDYVCQKYQWPFMEWDCETISCMQFKPLHFN